MSKRGISVSRPALKKVITKSPQRHGFWTQQYNRMEALRVIKMTEFSSTAIAKHTPPNGNLAKCDLIFSVNRENYHTINNFRRSHLLIWTGNTTHTLQTYGCYPAKPKVWHYTPYERSTTYSIYTDPQWTCSHGWRV